VSDLFEDYRDLDEALSEAGVPIAPAELHGGLCGTLCAGGDTAAQAWLDRCLDGSRGAPEQLESLRNRLVVLERRIRESLEDEEFSFQPCLPGDEHGIDDRVDALALWCHGFLAGLGLGGVDLDADSGSDSAELNEVVGDFAEISKAVVEPGEDDTEDGFAFAELTEYVRVGVQYIYELLNRGPGARRVTLH
jgi:yecA family protein